MKRLLRLSIMRDGRLIDDRRATRDVILGDRVLFRVDHGRSVLHVSEGVEAELALDGGAARPLAQLRPQEPMPEDEWELVLPETTRGWVRVGTLTFLVQFEAPVPPTPLPPGMRAGFASGLEAGFVAILLGVMSLQVLGIYALDRKPIIEDDFEPPPKPGFIATVLPEELPTPKPPEASAPRGEARTIVSTRTARGPAATPDRPAVDAAARDYVHQLLGGDSFQAILGNDRTDEIADMLTQVRDTAWADEGLVTRHSAGPEGPVTIGAFPAGRPDHPRQIPPIDRPLHPPHIDPPVVIDPIDPPLDAPPDLISVLKRKLPQVRRCYEAELKRDNDLHGKIVLGFDVTTRGRIANVDAELDTMHSDAVLDCIRLTMRTWASLPKPPQDVHISVPIIFMPAQHD